MDIRAIEAIWAKIPTLTPTQRKIVAMVGDGCFGNKKIAAFLGTSPETVSTHLHAIYAATGICRLIQLVGAMYWKTLVEHRELGPQPDEFLPQLLSPRELEVAYLIADGYSNIVIGTCLGGISHETVKCHVTNVLYKLGVSYRVEIAHRVLRERFLLLNSPQSPESKTPGIFLRHGRIKLC